MSRMRQLFRDAWAIARPYWFSEDRWAGRGLLVAVIALNLGIVFINVIKPAIATAPAPIGRM